MLEPPNPFVSALGARTAPCTHAQRCYAPSVEKRYGAIARFSPSRSPSPLPLLPLRSAAL